MFIYVIRLCFYPNKHAQKKNHFAAIFLAILYYRSLMKSHGRRCSKENGCPKT